MLQNHKFLPSHDVCTSIDACVLQQPERAICINHYACRILYPGSPLRCPQCAGTFACILQMSSRASCEQLVPILYASKFIYACLCAAGMVCKRAAVVFCMTSSQPPQGSPFHIVKSVTYNSRRKQEQQLLWLTTAGTNRNNNCCDLQQQAQTGTTTAVT